jgi:hypothetical protein
LHPGEVDKTKYQLTFADLREVTTYLSSEGKSTFELLAEADLHASIYSTCHYEALGLGRPTAILPFTNHETVFHLLDTGYAFLVETPQDMLTLLNKSRNMLVPPEVGNYFFTHNTLENLHQLIQ